MTRTRPSVVLLHDDAGLWAAAEPLLADDVAILLNENADRDHVIGVLTWRRATRREIAELKVLRERHGGPLLALVEQLPSVRGSRALAAGVEGSVLADDMPGALLPTVIAVAAGQCVVPRSVRQLVDRPALSPRERQVLAMVVLDFSNAEIAQKLVVTESNVKSHLTSAFGKIGVTSRSAATELILDAESGLGPGILRISPDDNPASD